MKTSLRKIGQASPQPAGNPAPQLRESSFTEADFATAIHKFIQGMNDFHTIGMIKTDTPALLSGAIGLATSILVAKPGANYLQRELALGSSRAAKSSNNVSPSIDDVFSAFSTRVSSRINSAFMKFSNLIKYSEELLEGKDIKADPARVSEYQKRKHLILRASSARELQSQLSDLISDISEALNNINEISGTNFSIIKQLLILGPAVGTELDIDEDTLSEKRYNLDNLPQNLILQLTNLLRELKALEILVSIAGSISSNYPPASSVSIRGTSGSSSGTPTQTTSGGRGGSPSPSGTPPVSSGSFFIHSIVAKSNFAFDTATNSLKLSNLTGSSQPSFTLAVSCQTPNLQPYDLFHLIYRAGLIKITDGSRLSNPPPGFLQVLNQIRDIITNSSSNNLILGISPNSTISGYNLKISLPANIAAQLVPYPGFVVFTIVTRSGTTLVKSGSNSYSFDSGISKINFTTNDLINDSSNISNIEKQKILNKLKNE